VAIITNVKVNLVDRDIYGLRVSLIFWIPASDCMAAVSRLETVLFLDETNPRRTGRVTPSFRERKNGTSLAHMEIAMAKILSNGRFWGSGTRVEGETRERVVKLLRSSELPIRTIAQRLGVSIDAVSAINVSENYIRPKGFRPERIF